MFDFLKKNTKTETLVLKNLIYWDIDEIGNIYFDNLSVNDLGFIPRVGDIFVLPIAELGFTKFDRVKVKVTEVKIVYHNSKSNLYSVNLNTQTVELYKDYKVVNKDGKILYSL